jgi:glycosyltransferase involved in cell wall biosynthesis
MSDNKKILIVISETRHFINKPIRTDHPLIFLAKFLASNSYQVSLITLGFEKQFNQEDYDFFKESKIEILIPMDRLNPTIIWLKTQYSVFETIHQLDFDLIISNLNGGPMALYSKLNSNATPVLTYVDDGVYLRKFESNTAFTSVVEILQGALESLQLKKSNLVIAAGQEIIDIYRSIEGDIPVLDNFIQMTKSLNMYLDPENVTRDFGRGFVLAIEKVLAETPKTSSDLLNQSVSVIIATRNREQFLPNALRSCVAQTFIPQEVIIVDDGSDSPDAIRTIVSSFSDSLNIKLLRNEMSLGQAKSRNLGAKHASNPFLAFLDDDNYLLTNHFEACLKILQDQSIAAACSFMNLVLSDEPIDQDAQIESVIIFAGDHFGTLNRIYNLATDTHLVIRRDFFEKIGGFPDLIRSSAEDWGIGLNIMAHGGKFKSTGLSTVMYRANTDGVLANVSGIKKWWPLHSSGKGMPFDDWWYHEFARASIYGDRTMLKSKRRRNFVHALTLIKLGRYASLVGGLRRQYFLFKSHKRWRN